MGLTEDNMNELYGSLGLDTVGKGDLEEAAIALMGSFFPEEDDDIVVEAP